MNAITTCPSRLLVIEDDPVLSADLGDYFRDRNHRVTLCRDGGEGLTLVLVEQKTDIALHLAQRAYVLVKGRVVMEDTSENLLRRGDLEDLYFAID